MASSSPDIDFRILLIGRTGHGKSSTGNTIAGKNVFKVSSTSKSQTKTFRIIGRIIEVVDTPGIFDTDLKEKEVQRELLKALALSTPGFHVIAFVLMKCRFTEEIQKTQEIFFDWFGEGVENFACVILTDTDNDREKDEYIQNDPHEKLAHLVEACCGKVVALNNKARVEVKEKQVKSIFEVIDTIKQSNKGEYFTNVAFQLAEKYVLSKYPLELTADSILLLGKAGIQGKMSGKQFQYLDRLFSVKTNAATVTAETNKESEGDATGNVPMFDSRTNERIPNTRRKTNQGEQLNVVNQFSSNALSDTLSDSQLSRSSEVSEVPGKTAVHEQPLKTEDKVTSFTKSEEVRSSSDQINRNAKVRKSRRGRKFVPGCVRYDKPPSRTTDLPSSVRYDIRSSPTTNLSGSVRYDIRSSPTTDLPGSVRYDIRSSPTTDLPGSVRYDIRSSPTTDLPGSVRYDIRSSPTTDLPGSVRYDIHSSSTTKFDTFKTNVNNEENSKEIKGLSDYLIQAWCYCQQQIKKCIL